MANSFGSLKDLELSRDEVERIETALKDKEFRKLLCEYVEEIQDPENQKTYQKEITQLEKERGYDVTFINPIGGYVIKTSVDGTKKAFVNVCANENIKKPTSSPMMQEGARGLQWSLPHSLTPPREDLDRKGVRCQVFDVVFHPDTLYLAKNNKAFANMVNRTACEAVESNFNVKLDCKNLKFPKMQYKGATHAAMIRKPSQTKPEKLEPEEQAIVDRVHQSMPKVVERVPKKYKLKKDDDNNKYTTPTYVIKHRSHIELDEFTEDKNAKLNKAIPKELIVEINLPLLKSANDITLDVTDKVIKLTSEKPSKYKLDLTLPYSVVQDKGNAKFDTDTKKLVITLPVIRNEALTLVKSDDSGVESDSPVNSSSPMEEILSYENAVTEDEINNVKSEYRTSESNFLNPDTQYNLPEFNCHIFENILAFTLQVKNVDESTLEKKIDSNSVHVKFCTISSGFYPVNYAFYVKIQEHAVKVDDVTVEIWDNNVVIQIPVTTNDKLLKSYLFGIDGSDCNKRFIEEPAIINNHYENTTKEKLDREEQNESKNKKPKKMKRAKNVQMEEVKINEDENKPVSKAIDIVGAGSISESSGDELSYSYSPSKSKGILKRFTTNSHSSVSRSVSESSMDDMLWASSFENYSASLDSVVQHDGEVSSSLKKTVRFNDVVLKQLYRSNSSILGQKKKNQRKSRNKKRAQERRHSESELSELDERMERDVKTMEGEVEREDGGALILEAVDQPENVGEEEEGTNDIFDCDI